VLQLDFPKAKSVSPNYVFTPFKIIPPHVILSYSKLFSTIPSYIILIIFGFSNLRHYKLFLVIPPYVIIGQKIVYIYIPFYITIGYFLLFHRPLLYVFLLFYRDV